MTFAALLERVAELEIRWTEDAGRLRVNAPDGALTPDLVAALRDHKAALLAQRRTPPPEVAGPHPLSLAQERLWFLETMGGVGAAYTVAGAVRITGPLDVDALDHAFQLVQARHPMLRARFSEVDGRPVQSIAPLEASVPLTRRAWHGDAEAARVAAQADAHVPFVMTGGALVRATVHVVTPQESLLAVTLHHLICDGGSLTILVRDWVRAYTAVREGRQPDWAPLPLRYVDAAVEQRTRLARGQCDREVAYWQAHLDGAPDAITLPVDRTRPPVTTFRGQSVPVSVSPDVARRVRETAAALGATPVMVTLAAWADLLMRLSAQDDVVIGVPVSGRPIGTGDDVIGLFVNALPMRTRRTPGRTFADLVADVRTTVVDALAHADVPWEFLLDVLQPKRDVSRSPVFQVSFTLQDHPVGGLATADLTFTDVPVPVEAAKFELSMELQPSPDGGFAGVLEFNADLFDRETAARVVARFERLLAVVVRDPATVLDAVSVLLDDEETQLAAAWSGPRVPLDVAASIPDALARVVQRAGSRTAIVGPDAEISYAELHAQVQRAAHALAEQGVVAGDRVGVVVTRTTGTLVHLFGVLSAGAAYVPIDPSWPAERRAAVVAAASCRLVLDDTWQPAGHAPLPGVSADLAAYVIFTSGSTGIPKGVVVEHRSVRHLIEALEFSVYQPLGLGEDCRVSVNGALTFDTSVKQIFQLLQGRTLVLVPEPVRLDGAALLAHVRHAAVDVLDATPSQLVWLLEAGLAEEPGSVRAVLAGGEALPRSVWERMRRPAAPALVNLYGPTECTVDATVHILRPSDEAPRLGRPLPNMVVSVLDAALRPVPIGMPGEIMIGGPGVARGYLGDSDATTRAFIASPVPAVCTTRMYRTGDRGRVRADGLLEFLGRVDDQVKVRGHRVELGDVEQALLHHDAVRAACALVVDADRLVAAVAVDPLRSPTVEGRARHTLANGLSVLHLNRNETDFLYGEMFERNAYLRHGVHLHDGATVLDVGSNIGMFVVSAQVRYAGLRLVCVEPNPHVRELLEANLRLFGADAQVWDCGIGAEAGTAEFTFYPGFSILSGLHADVSDEKDVVRSYIRRQQDLAGSDDATVEEVLAAKLRPVTLPVPLRPLSDVIDGSNLTRIDLLKINVEKAELDVLRGIRPDQWDRIRQVAFELHDVEGRLQAALDLLHGYGFEVHVEEDWSLEHEAGTNYYLYAVRPGQGRAEGPIETPRLATFLRPLVTGDAIRAAVAAQVPEYMVPDVCLVVDRLPTTAHGKVDRRAIACWSWTRAGRGQDDLARELTPTELRLAGLWSDVLDVARWAADDHFFDSGGHSLSAARLAGRVRDAFGVPFTVGAVFDAPVLADMAARVEAMRPDAVGAPVLQAHGHDGPQPVSFAQERLLFLEQLDGGGAAYVISGALQLEGPLDVALLGQAVSDVVRRHPVLRSVFPPHAASPVAQIVDDMPTLVVDALPASAPDATSGVRDWVEAQAGAAFDLSRELPLRVRLLRVDAAFHVLAVACHHVVADGWSVGVFLRDVSAQYQARQAGQAPSVPALPVTYYDVARWQRARLSGAYLEAGLTYWRETLAGAAPSLDLPTDRPRPPITSYAGHSVSWDMGPAVRARVEAFARAHQATPYMVLCAAWAILLHRWTGQHDIVIGSPVAGRTVAGTDDLIGLFVNTVVVRLDLEDVVTGGDLIGRTRAAVRGALDHQDIPFELVVGAIRPPRRLDRHPVFQVMFALQNLPTAALDLPGVRWTPYHVPSTVARFDLSLVIDETSDAYRATVEYATALFDESTMLRLRDRFLRVLDALLGDPGVAIATMALTGPDDVAQIRRWNATDRDYGPFVPVLEMVAAQAWRTPEAVALTYQGTTMTYAGMMRRAHHVAAELRRRGVRPGDIVAFSTDRSPMWVIALLGILDVGALFLPIDPDFPQERVRWMLADSKAVLLLSQTHLDPPADVPVVWLEHLPYDTEPPHAASWVPGPDDAAYVIYTSGSTGRPKGAVNLHRGFSNLVHNFMERFGTTPESQALHFSSISFDSSLCEVFMALAVGGTAVLAARDEILPGAPLEQVLAERRVTHATIPPSALGGMVDPHLPSLQVLLSAGEVCPPDVVQRWGGGRRFYNAYGPTESSVCSSVMHVRPGDVRVPIGRPLCNVRVHILDPARRTVPVGMPGEIAIGGVGVAQGYLDRPDLTAERFVTIDPYGDGGAERVYLTGDQGRYLPDGPVEFLGRQDSQIKLRGYRIELGEIETAFRAHDSVRDCAVVVQEMSGPHAQKRLVAFVVSEGAPAPPRVIKDFLRTRLPEYMVPPVIVPIDRVPQTTGGKRDTRALERWDVSQVIGADGGDTGEGTAEVAPEARDVAAVFAEVLGQESFGSGDDFFEHGGHSLLAARVIGRVRERLGVELTLRTLFEAPTPALLGARIRAATAATLPPVSAAPDAEARRVVSAAQRRLWFLDRLQPSEAYTMVAAVRLRGVLDLPAWTRAAQELSARHEILRSRYPGDGAPEVVIDPSPIPLRTVDVGADDVLDQATADARMPFDLAHGPLFRPVLYRVAEDDHLFVASMHHIVSDGWSIGVLVRDLADAYLGRPGTAPLQYGDYACWWDTAFTGAPLEQQLAYWRRRLDGADRQLHLPTDRPRPAELSSRGSRVAETWPETRVSAVDAMAARTRTGRFAVLMTAWAAWVARLSGQQSFIVGTPVANRRDPQFESVVGLFANTLPIRADIPADDSFETLLRRMADGLADDLSHADVPFDLIVQAMHPERDRSRSPLFQVMFAMSTGLVPALGLPGLSLEPLALDVPAAKFDLTLFVDEAEAPGASSGGLRVTLEFNTGLFEEVTARRLLAGFSAFLDALQRRPDQPVGDVPALSALDRAQLDAWNGTATYEAPDEQRPTPLERIEAQVDRTPQAPAVRGTDRVWSYGELDRRANQLARALVARGVTRDVLVGVCLERTPDLIVALLAVWKAGGAWVPIDPRYPAARIAFMAEDARLRLVLTTAAIGGTLPDDLPMLAIDRERDAVAAVSDVRLQGPRVLTDTAYVIYTSGSTGTPKGVVVEHGALEHYLAWAVDAYRMTEGRGVPVAGSIAFDATITSVFGPLLVGQCLRLIPDGEEIDALADPRSAAADESFWKITPSHLDAVTVGADPESLSGRVRHLVIGGEALHGRTILPWAAAAPEVLVTNEYGPTETVVGCVVYIARAADMPDGPVPIGRPIARTIIGLRDARGQEVPLGAVGEIHIAGAGVAREYLGRPALTAERFVEIDGRRWYRTGDLARWNAWGQLEYLGRRDTQVKVRGHRIELGEIDAVAAEQSVVRQAATIVLETAGGRESRLVLCVVPADGATVDQSALLAALRRRLPEVMVPSAVRFVDHLPLTSNGKLDRDRLTTLAATEETEGVADLAHGDAFASSSSAAVVVAAAWTEVLGRPPASPDEDFFDAGGHSLLAAQLAARLRTTAGGALPVRTVFDQPTWRGLASVVAAGCTDLVSLPPLTRSGGAPVVSYGQQRLWALAQFDDTGAAYHIPLVFRLRGALDVAALTGAWHDVVTRHDVLRLCIRMDDGVPVAALTDHWPALEVTDGPWEPAVTAPFALETGPLVRAVLARAQAQGDDGWVLVVVLHHIVSDGWSSGVLARDLRDAYTRRRSGRTDGLPALPMQYADWAAWQRQVLQGEALTRLADYWRGELRGAPPVLELPLDHARPGRQGYAGAAVSVTVPPQVRTALVAAAREHGVTMYMVLLAGYAALLASWSGRDDLVIGTTVANRTQAQTEDLVGFFVNTIPLRLRVDAQAAFADLVRDTRDTTLRGLDHQALPFERLVELLALPRNPAVSPLVQTLFTYQHVAGTRLTLPDVAVTDVPLPHDTAKFDLTLAADDDGRSVTLHFEYRTDLFTQATIRTVAERYVAGLAWVADRMAAPVADIPFIGAEDLRRLAQWNDTGRDYGESPSIDQLFEAQARRTPDAAALRADGASLSYADLHTHAERLAARLRAQGVGPDTLVGVYLERSFELFVALFAILKAGGAYVPLDPEYPAARLAGMIDDAAMPVLVTTQALAARGVPAGTTCTPVVLVVDAVGRPDGPDDHEGESRVERSLDDLAYCIFTSGSTGRPKGAAIPHRAIQNRLLWMQEAYPLGPDDVVVHKTPISFDVSVWELFWPLMVGASIAIARPGGHRDAAYLSRLIRDERVTTVHFVPSMLQVFLEEPLADDLPTLRRIVTSGEALSWETARRCLTRYGCPMYNLYGPTEAAVDVTAWPVRIGADPHAIPIGRPIANTRIHILNERLERVPIGVAGELHIGGVNLARGYVNQPELTAERFFPNPFRADAGESDRLYRTGDLARWRPDGQLEYLGRLDAQVKLRGFRIELGEIETALRQQPGVADAAVTVGTGDRLIAYVVPTRGCTVQSNALRTAVAQRLPEYMVPSVVVPLEALPLGPSGKLDRRALPEPEVGVSTGTDRPETPTEQVLAAIWGDVLQMATPGRTDSFFAIGGDSLRAIQVAARARRAGLAVTPALLLEHQTVAALAAALDASSTTSGPDAGSGILPEPGPVVGEAPTAPIVRWFADLGLAEPQYFGQCVIVSLPADVRTDQVREALRVVASTHEALRLRVDLAADPVRVWYAEPVVEDDTEACGHASLAGVSADARPARMTALATTLQAGLDPRRGPLWRAVHVTTDDGAPARMIWAVHHLGIDGMSWGVLVQDFAEALAALRQGTTPAPSPRTHSWRQWLWAWQDAAASGRLESDRAYWRSRPLHLAAGAQVQEALTVSKGAPAAHEQTTVVVSSGRRVSQQDVLAALWEAWTEVTGQAVLAVDMESHGRVSPEEQLDLSRSVGWFTAVYPVVLAPDPAASVQATVQSVLAAVPHAGVSYGVLRYLAGDAELSRQGRPPVLFNFLGDAEAVVSERHGVAVSDEDPGRGSSPRNQSPYALELVAGVSNGHLRVHMRSPADGLGAACLEALAGAMGERLRRQGERSPLVFLKGTAGPDGPAPVFLVHPAGGTVFCYGALAQAIDVPVCGLQAPGLRDGEVPVSTVEGLSSRYADWIMREQPQGPYRIGGWSYGGIVAFDVARRLLAAGRQVERLIILDTLAPGAVPPAEWAKDSATLLGDIFGADAGVAVDALAGLSLDVQLQQVTERAVAAGVLPENFTAADARRAWAVFQAHRRAEQAYVAAPLAVNVLLFASDLRRRDSDRTMGWGRWASEVEVVEVPGNHSDVLRPPAVMAVAAAIEKGFSTPVSRIRA